LALFVLSLDLLRDRDLGKQDFAASSSSSTSPATSVTLLRKFFGWFLWDHSKPCGGISHVFVIVNIEKFNEQGFIEVVERLNH